MTTSHHFPFFLVVVGFWFGPDLSGGGGGGGIKYRPYFLEHYRYYWH